MSRSRIATNTFNAVELLDIKSTHPKYFNCVGVTLKGERCRCQVARVNVDEGMYQLEQLPLHASNPEELQRRLESVAGRLLCRSERVKHQGQATTVASKWRTTIISEQARQARLERTRRSRRIVSDTDGNISMSREARAREERLEEQRTEQLRSGECPICYDPLNIPCETACVHVFCHSCVVPWIERHGSCPTCRAQATVHELVVIDNPQIARRPRPGDVQPARVQRSTLQGEEASSARSTIRARTSLSPEARSVAATPVETPVQQATEIRERQRRVWTRRIEQLSHDCPICIDVLEVPCETACSHIFCQSCLTRWLQNSGTCPECRAHVREEALTLI